MKLGGRFRRVMAVMAPLVLVLSGVMAEAQSRFSPAIRVGDDIVTRYQLDQRTLFLSVLRAPGDPRDLAQEQLINEAIQLNAAEEAGLEPSAAEIEAGMSEFAARANLSADEFVTALGQAGVGAETFRDFIRAGVAWRTYVRETFGEEARDFPRDQINRTISQTGTEGGVRVLLSEIILPASSPETEAASRARAAGLLQLDEDAFAAAARKFSIVPSAPAGGAQSWLAMDALPPEIASAVSRLQPGQTTGIVEQADVIGVYLLRDREVVAAGAPEDLSVDYALFIVGGGTADAASVARSIDTCDDLYGVAKGLPEERLIRETQPVSSLPADIRQAVATMDPGETSTAVQRAGFATVLMLCSREPALKSDVDVNIIGNRLLNARLGSLAANRLADLRARTVVDVLSR